MNRSRASLNTVLTGWFLVVFIAPLGAHAAVEFVTPVDVCDQVDTIGDGKDLSLQAGPDIQFEVWGDGIDVRKQVRLTSDDTNAGAVTVRIVRAHGGLENMGRCNMNKGSVEVEVDSPANTTQVLQRSLHFMMPLGDESRLQTRVVPFVQPVWFWTGFVQSPPNCLTKSVGTVVTDSQNTRLTITLPAGADSDTSNCSLDFQTHVDWATTPEIDIGRKVAFAIGATPSFMSLVSDTNSSTLPTKPTNPRFTGNVADLRSTQPATSGGTKGRFALPTLGGNRSATPTITTPNALTDSLTVVIKPPPVANAFTQAVACRNQQTGTTVNTLDAFDCEIRLAQTPPAAGQLISFEVRDRNCVEAGNSSVAYSRATGLGTFTAAASGTIHQVPLRALGGLTSAGTACASSTAPVAHSLLFWVGPRDTESGPDFSTTQIRIRLPL